jgi:nuclear transcription Y subunit beta
VNEYDRFLPVANIGRIIKNNLPKEVKLSKEAKETFQECVSEFISFITSEASEKCNIEKRKTINGDDIVHALTTLGFDHYTPTLKVYLEKYRESQKLVTDKGVEDSEDKDYELCDK